MILIKSIFLLLVNFFFLINFNFICLIKGGSKGIGKAIAIEALKNGCKCVTIVARNLNSLKEANEELIKYCTNEQFIQYFQLDLTSDPKTVYLMNLLFFNF